MRRFLNSFLILLLIAPRAFAEISVEVTPQEGTLEDRFVLKVTVVGSGEKPQIPDLGKINIISQSQSSRVQMQMGNGFKLQTTRTNEYSYELDVPMPGKYTIPAISAMVDGKKQSAGPVTFEVLAAGSAKNRPNKSPSKSKSRSSKTQVVSASSNVLLETEVSNPNPYVGESTVFILRILNSGPIQQARLLDTEIPNAKVSEIEKVRQYVTKRNGKQYNVNEKRFVLIPQKAGPIVIPSMKLQAYVRDDSVGRNAKKSRIRSLGPFDDFFGDFDSIFNRSVMVPKKFASPQTYIEVQALPKPRPVDFSGIVGKFKLSASAAPKELKVGDSGTVTITLKGEGKSAGLEDFKPKFPESFQVYPDKPKLVENVTTKGWNSTQSFKFAFVPKSGGTFDLDQIKIRVFDTKSGKYKLLKAPLGTVKVKGAVLSAAAIDQKKSGVAQVGKVPDMLTKQQIKSYSSKVGVSRIMLGCLILLCWMPVVLIFIKKYRSSGSRSNKKIFYKKLRELQSLVEGFSSASADSHKSGLVSIDGKTRELLTLSLGQNCHSLTPSEIKIKLSAANFEQSKIPACLEKIDRMKYSGSSIDIQSIRSELREVIEGLEKLV